MIGMEGERERESQGNLCCQRDDGDDDEIGIHDM